MGTVVIDGTLSANYVLHDDSTIREAVAAPLCCAAVVTRFIFPWYGMCSQN